MKRIIFIIMIFGISLFMMAGCDDSPARPEFDAKISIFGFLWGGEALTQDRGITITYTQPPEAYYDLNAAAVKDADVTLTDETSGTSYTLTADPDNPAYFYNVDLIIQPDVTYTLTVVTDDRTVRATTHVPQALTLETDLDSENVNEEYHENLGYEKPVYITSPNESQLILVDMYCNEEWNTAEYINPFFTDDPYPQNEEEYDQGMNAEPRHIWAIIPYRYLIAPDFENRHTVFWYSSMIVFYGSNTMQILAIDDNYHHYLTDEHPEWSGGVENGIGCFGSVCGEDFELDILKP